MGISFYGEIGVEIPKTSNDQVTTDILFNWSTPLVLTPADYVFEQQYFFYEKSSNITKNAYTFQTTRLRCGYIEEEYIVLSLRGKMQALHIWYILLMIVYSQIMWY